MPVIYDLWHFKIDGATQANQADPAQAAKELGSYSSEERATAAMTRRRSEPGFRDWPDGFRIVQVALEGNRPCERAAPPGKIFTLWHFRIGAADDEDFGEPSHAATQIGNYSDAAGAEAARARSRARPEFRNFPDGFRIFSELPDIDHWVGGFVSWDEA